MTAVCGNIFITRWYLDLNWMLRVVGCQVTPAFKEDYKKEKKK